MKQPQKNKILIIAAEESSAHYGLRLLQLWKRQGRSIEAFGIGNREMEREGFEILGRAEDLAVFGLVEIWNHWGDIKKAFHAVVKATEKRKPDLVLLMDYPGFNFRLAKRLKKLNIPIVYFIPPQVWAWRQGRTKFLSKMIDENLVLFPFEEEFYKVRGVHAKFVGHPLLDDIGEDLLDPEVQRLNRRRFGISDDKVVLGLMPGSRHSEIKLNFKTQLETARVLRSKIPNLQIIILVAPNLDKDFISLSLPALDFPIQLVQSPPFEMIGMSDVILCASGTATLMVALMEKPMVIMYRMNRLSGFLARHIVKVKFFGLVNLIMEREIAPERFQELANPTHLAEVLLPYLQDAQIREGKARELSELKGRLGQRGAIERVAAHIEKYFSDQSHA